MPRPQILVPLSCHAEDDPLLAQAMSVTDLMNAQTLALLAQPDPNDIMVWSGGGTYIGTAPGLVEAAWKGADEAWEKCTAQIKALGIAGAKLKLERAIGPVDATIAKRAALANFTMFSCETSRGKGLLSGAFEALLLEAHEPIFIPRLPAQELSAGLQKAAMIAWNGSIEAARAVHAALPLLTASQRVIVATVPSPDDDKRNHFATSQYLVDHLTSLNVKAEAINLAGKNAPEAILKAAQAHDVGLLVSGAWGHSRAREFIFGGATRTFLKDQNSPSLLLCH